MPEPSEHTATLGGQPVFWRERGRRPGPTPRRSSTSTACPTSADDWLAVPRAHRRPGARPARLRPLGQARRRRLHDGRLRALRRGVPRPRGVDRVRLVVHDWGAVGLLWAQRHPERVERLVVIDAVPFAARLPLARAGARVAHAAVLGEVVDGPDHDAASGCARSMPREPSPTRSGRTSTRAPSARSCGCTARAPEDALAARRRASWATLDLPGARRLGRRTTRYIPPRFAARLRRRAGRPGRGAHARGRRALAVARPPRGRPTRSSRSSMAEPAPSGCWRRCAAVPAWAAAVALAACTSCSPRRPPTTPPRSTAPGCGSGDLGQRLVRRPPHPRLQRPVPAARRALLGARLDGRAGRGRARPGPSSACVARTRAAAARAGRAVVRRRRRGDAAGHRPADVRARRRASALAALLALARGAPAPAAALAVADRAREPGRRARSSRSRRAAWWLDRAAARAALGAAGCAAAGCPAWRSRVAVPRGRQRSRSPPRASGPRWPRRSLVASCCAARHRARCASAPSSTRRAGGAASCSTRRWAATPCASARCSAGPLLALRAVAPAPPSLLALVASRCCTGSGSRRSTTGPRRRRPVGRTRSYYAAAARRAASAQARARPFRVEVPFTDNHWEAALRRAARPARARLGAPARPQAQRALLRRHADAGALPALARRQRGRATSRCPTRRSTTRRAPRRRSSRRRPAVPARGLARRALARVRGARRRAAGRGAARVTALGPDRVDLRATARGRGRPARALHAVLGARAGRGCVARAAATGRGCALRAPGTRQARARASPLRADRRALSGAARVR